MTKKLLLVLALAGLLPLGAAAVYAADPPVDPGMTAEPADPNAAPDPPDGTTDPNANYPTDGTMGTDQGEDGAPPNAGDAPAGGPAGAPAGGKAPPD